MPAVFCGETRESGGPSSSSADSGDGAIEQEALLQLAGPFYSDYVAKRAELFFHHSRALESPGGCPKDSSHAHGLATTTNPSGMGLGGNSGSEVTRLRDGFSLGS